MDISFIRKQILKFSNQNDIILIQSVSDQSGFFTSEGKLLYMVKDIFNYSYENIETDFLSLQTHLFVTSINNGQTFDSDYYDVIVFKGDINDNIFAQFVNLCEIYSNNLEQLAFREFFYSLISLFQLSSEQSFKNAIGFYGELKFLKYAYEEYGVDLSECWHKAGPLSKHDFSSVGIAIEVKTTSSESKNVIIKHDQIYNDLPCFIAVVDCDQSDTGESIEELVKTIYDNSLAFKGIGFNINLSKEIARISPSDYKDMRIKTNAIYLFDSRSVNPFPLVPDTVTKLNYSLDVSDFEQLNSIEKKNIIESFI